MLIKFKELVEKYGKPKGVIHIGAHMLEEQKQYLEYSLDNTIWVEANPKIYQKAISKLKNSEKLFNHTICDVNDETMIFNVTNNGQSSSILELDVHKKYYPQINVTERIEVKSIRMDKLISDNNINILDYDFLNLDIQGAELLALKGFGEILNHIKFIYTEVNTNTLYKNCALLEDIDAYLCNYDFERVEIKMNRDEWGDAFYIKKIVN
jgi:FkbM family methyltransferase